MASNKDYFGLIIKLLMNVVIELMVFKRIACIVTSLLFSGVSINALAIQSIESSSRSPVSATSPYIPSNNKVNNILNKYVPLMKRQLAAEGFSFGAPLLIRIFKVPAILEVWIKKNGRFELFKTYAICKYSGKLGPKTQNGDNQAPEGFYDIYPKQLNPNSSYFLSFNLGYPNYYDRSHHYTGSALMVHGECASVGCYAMNNTRISEIYTLMYGAFANHQEAIQVQVYPFALTASNLNKMRKHKWYGFWLNLKQGYDYFEKTQQQPLVIIHDGRYEFIKQSQHDTQFKP